MTNIKLKYRVGARLTSRAGKPFYSWMFDNGLIERPIYSAPRMVLDPDEQLSIANLDNTI